MVLLDTHALIWYVDGEHRFGAKAKELCDLALEEGGLYVSVLSFYEISLLQIRHKLRLHPAMPEWRSRVLGLDIEEADLTGEIAAEASKLRSMNSDPFDQLITTTALLNDWVLVTVDRKILAWDGPLLRQNLTV